MTLNEKVEALGYDAFLQRLRWKQGEHIALIGPTGLGKTTLGLDLLRFRDYVTIIGTKPKDDTLRKFARKNHYTIISEFPQYFDEVDHKHLILWPSMKRFRDIRRQRLAIGHGLQTMFLQRNWCIFADEVSYIANELKLEPHLRIIWQQGRSIGISLMASTQRPAFVPLLLYDQSTHLFFWRDNDERNLKRIGGIGWLNARHIAQIVAGLDKHNFLYLNSRTGEMAISRCRNPLH